MDTELLKSMFLRARDHYESAVRWAFIGILICLSLHLITFSQFVRLGKQLSRVQDEIIRFSDFESTVTNIESKLIQLQGIATTALNTRIEIMLDELIGDFTALDRTIASLHPTSSAIAAGTPLSQDPTLQMQAFQRSGKIIKLDEEQKSQIRETKDIDELRRVLLPVIEREIIHPRFDELNNYWNNTVLPDITQQAESILKDLQENQPPSFEYKGLWDEIRHTVEQTVATTTTLKFQPPAKDPYWWASVAGKTEELSNIEHATVRELKAIAGFEAVAELSRQIGEALGQRKELQATLQEELKRIEENFNKQQSQLAALGKPFEVLSLDINALVSRFPLLLGIVLAAITVWPAYRLWELAWAADLMAKKGQEPIPWEWFWGKIWSFVPKSKGTESREEPQQPIRQNRHWILEGFCRCLIFGIWIGIAAWQLNGWETIDFRHLALFTIGGWVAVVAAQGYRLYIIRRILILNERSL